MDHLSLSPVHLSDGTAMKAMATDMTEMTDLTDMADLANTANAAGTLEMRDTADSADSADRARSSSSDAIHTHTPGGPQPGSSVRRRTTTNSSRTRAGTGRPLKINYPKKRVSVACDVCRARKTRCDARRPACSFCAQLGIDCVYRRGGSNGNNNSDGGTPGTGTPKSDSLSKTDIVARLGRLESLLREKESTASSSAETSPQKDTGTGPGQLTGDSPVVLPPIPSPVVPFSVVSPYVGGHSPEQYHYHQNHQQHHQQHRSHQHQHNQEHHHHHQPQQLLHHESLSPYVTTTTTPSDRDTTTANITATVAGSNTRPSPLFGYRLDSLSRLGPNAASLPSLRALCCLDVDAELETELFGQATENTGLLSAGLNDSLDLSPRRCWSLEQAFSRDVLPWCPIIEQHECAELVARAAEDGFPRGRLETAVALLVLALGSFARGSDHSHHSHSRNGQNGLPGIDYFHAGRQVVHNAAGASGASARYSIMRVQCDLLVTFYFLFSLKPILAFEVLSSAGLRLLMLLQLRPSSSSSSLSAAAARQASSPSSSSTTTGTSPSDGREDPTYDERLHRAYWTCYLLEHELQAYVSFSARLLQERREFVPLPLSNYEEPGMYWFLSEIALRGICSSMQDDPGYYSKKPGGGRGSAGIGCGGVAWNEHMLDAPMLVEEVTLQLLAWHANLAAPVTFPLDEPSFISPSTAIVPVLRPLLDPHKVFLRAQFYAVQATLRWPFVVQLLMDQTGQTGTTASRVDGAAASLHYAVLHVYAVEPLMQDRHLMLFANIAGLFCVTMLLLCAHGLPLLTAIQHPGTEAAVRAALASLRIWQAEPNVQAMVIRVEELARAKGVRVT